MQTMTPASRRLHVCYGDAVDAYNAAKDAGGFRNQTAMKVALQSLNNAYGLARRDDDTPDPQFLCPLELHQVRARHASLFTADNWTVVNLLIELRAAIRDLGVKADQPASKAEVARQEVVRRRQENPRLVALFEGPINAGIQQRTIESLTAQAHRMVEAYCHPFSTKAWLERIEAAPTQRMKDAIRDQRTRYANIVGGDGAPNRQEIERIAEHTAQVEIAAVLPKMLLKLGATQISDGQYFGGGRLTLTGALSGRKVVIQQQVVLKTSPLGTLFYQWPARIYVDGKFMPEAEFARLADVS